ncbi:MAG: hypothetical protein JRJ51_25535, partial [Deltaproteobacteria bacterium]|nr:hypothetical protein [Deltaproteobacteria bacterium]
PLMTAVRESGAHLGVAFDGDGDRIAVVDDRGGIMASEHLGMILLKGPLRPGHGVPVIIDLKCSMHLDELIRRLKGNPIRCKSGHAYMKEMVLERGAIMGIELSGHVFLGSLNGRDDPVYTALVLAAYLAKETRLIIFSKPFKKAWKGPGWRCWTGCGCSGKMAGCWCENPSQNPRLPFGGKAKALKT